MYNHYGNYHPRTTYDYQADANPLYGTVQQQVNPQHPSQVPFPAPAATMAPHATNYFKSTTSKQMAARLRYNPLSPTNYYPNSYSTNPHTSTQFNQLYHCNTVTSPTTSSSSYYCNPPDGYQHQWPNYGLHYGQVSRSRGNAAAVPYCTDACCQGGFQQQKKLPSSNTNAKLNLKEFLESWNENSDDPNSTASTSLPDLVLSNSHGQSAVSTGTQFCDVDKIFNDDSFWFNMTDDMEVSRLVEELNHECKLKMLEAIKVPNIESSIATANEKTGVHNSDLTIGDGENIVAVQCQIQIDDKNNVHVTYQKKKA